ncbi:hypothetical protein PMG11_03720 [Penicillium brasilianum]|uniref:Uncharacterized protein n=1 Tax=Penicillium brasilianum TaxID=104259 RepID=A0A0F7VE87_PENBI|nr:hypothetical protein PMG11_03720 [Penicillium brasilianum]
MLTFPVSWTTIVTGSSTLTQPVTSTSTITVTSIITNVVPPPSSAPQPTEPAPVQSSPAAPQPTEPAPVQTSPAAPQPTAPAPVQSSPAASPVTSSIQTIAPVSPATTSPAFNGASSQFQRSLIGLIPALAVVLALI